jgi:selenocysteine-specific elongation factor
VTTIGGGVVLDNAATRIHRSDNIAGFLAIVESGSRAEILDGMLRRGRLGMEASELLARSGWTDSELHNVLDSSVAVNEKPLVLADRARFEASLTAVLDEVRRFHDANPLQAGITREALREKTLPHAHPAVFDAALARLTRDGKLVDAGEIVQQVGRGIVMNDAEAEAKRSIAAAFERAGLQAPPLKEVLENLAMDASRKQRLLQILLKERVLVRVSPELIFHASALDWLRELLIQHKANSIKINVGQFKELTAISRKYAIPLLEYLDRERVTRRVGDERIIL